MGALFNGLGRLFWGVTSDRIGFKKSFIILSAIQSVLHTFYPMAANNKATFLIMHSLCHVCLAGCFALMPPAIQKIFGPKNGALIYGLVYSAFGALYPMCFSFNLSSFMSRLCIYRGYVHLEGNHQRHTWC